MKIITKEEIMPLFYSLVILLALAFIGSLTTNTSSKTMFSLFFALFFYFILPGYLVMLNFKNLDSLERVFIGMVVSSAVIPLILYAVNVFGFKISRVNIIVAILFIVIFALLIKYFWNDDG